jgi:hypothetical protein
VPSTLGPDGVGDSNETVQLIGTFTSISFTTTYSGSTEDGILLQVGAAAPVSPPPPPPPSSAPVVSSVSVMGSPVAGRPVVVAATVRGLAQRLVWTVRGTTLIGGAGQSFLRFRPPAGPTTVTVRAISPAGVIGPARFQTIFGTKLPAGGLAGRISALVAKGPSVFAIGSSGLAGGSLWPRPRVRPRRQ